MFVDLSDFAANFKRERTFDNTNEALLISYFYISGNQQLLGDSRIGGEVCYEAFVSLSVGTRKIETPNFDQIKAPASILTIINF